MDKIELQVANRETLGKKVKHLRRQGITPRASFRARYRVSGTTVRHR